MIGRWFVDASDGWCAVLNLNGAAIEGTHAEMLELAAALSTPGTDYRAAETYRCAARWRELGRVEVSSPRNSVRPTELEASIAAQLAREIREAIASEPAQTTQLSAAHDPDESGSD